MYDYGGNEYWGSSEQSGITPTVKALLIANIVIYFMLLLLSAIFGRAKGLNFDRLVEFVGFVPSKGFERWYLWQYITYAFVHAQNPFHILFNMYVLWWAGSEIERRMGQRQFLLLYMTAALGAIMLHIPYAYLSGLRASPVVGASGAIMALLVVFAGMFPDRKIYLFVFGPFTARSIVIIFILIDFAFLLSQESQTANAVHIGGALYGFAYLKLSHRVEEFFERIRTRLEEEERMAQRNLKIDLDNVLRKIHSEGMESLSREERAILNKASKHYREGNEHPL